MKIVHHKFSLNKRPAVSQIIGSLIVLAIVASIGSVILFQGLNQINKFDPVSQTFIRFPLAGYSIRAIHEDKFSGGKYLWLGTAGGGLWPAGAGVGGGAGDAFCARAAC